MENKQQTSSSVPRWRGCAKTHTQVLKDLLPPASVDRACDDVVRLDWYNNADKSNGVHVYVFHILLCVSRQLETSRPALDNLLGDLGRGGDN